MGARTHCSTHSSKLLDGDCVCAPRRGRGQVRPCSCARDHDLLPPPGGAARASDRGAQAVESSSCASRKAPPTPNTDRPGAQRAHMSDALATATDAASKNDCRHKKSALAAAAARAHNHVRGSPHAWEQGLVQKVGRRV